MGEYLISLGKISNNKKQVVFFPHSGGSVYSFIPFVKILDSCATFYGIELPGRGNRINESFQEDFLQLIKELSLQLRKLEGEVIFIGHSIGALIAFECIRYLDQHFNFKVNSLIVSGQSAPQFVFNTLLVDWDADNTTLIRNLINLGGISAEILQYPELVDLIIPIIKADCKLLDSYSYVPGTIRSNILCVIANNDPIVSTKNAKKWQECTSNKFSFSKITGDHFSIINDQNVINQVAALLIDTKIL